MFLICCIQNFIISINYISQKRFTIVVIGTSNIPIKGPLEKYRSSLLALNRHSVISQSDTNEIPKCDKFVIYEICIFRLQFLVIQFSDNRKKNRQKICTISLKLIFSLIGNTIHRYSVTISAVMHWVIKSSPFSKVV